MIPALFFVVVAGLSAAAIIVKKILLNTTDKETAKALPDGTRFGNAQYMGNEDNQNDYFASLFKDGVFFAVIAESVTNRRSGKLASVIAVETLKKNFLRGVFQAKGAREFFTESVNEINRRLQDECGGNQFGVRLIGALVEDGILHFISVGNCSLFLYRNNELIYLNDIESQKAEISKTNLMKRDILLLCGKGARESLTEMEILWHLSKKSHPHEKCQKLVREIRLKRLAHQGNATVIAVEKTR